MYCNNRKILNALPDIASLGDSVSKRREKCMYMNACVCVCVCVCVCIYSINILFG